MILRRLGPRHPAVAQPQPPPDPARLCPFAAEFADPEFVFGAWHGGEGQVSYFQLSPQAAAFVAAAYAGDWVRPSIHWSTFAAGPDYRRLRGDPDAIATADGALLAQLLTTLIRGDRFNEGLLAGAFEDGTLTAVVRRMDMLAAGQSSSRSVSGSRSPS